MPKNSLKSLRKSRRGIAAPYQPDVAYKPLWQGGSEDYYNPRNWLRMLGGWLGTELPSDYRGYPGIHPWQPNYTQPGTPSQIPGMSIGAGPGVGEFTPGWSRGTRNQPYIGPQGGGAPDWSQYPAEGGISEPTFYPRSEQEMRQRARMQAYYNYYYGGGTTTTPAATQKREGPMTYIGGGRYVPTWLYNRPIWQYEYGYAPYYPRIAGMNKRRWPKHEVPAGTPVTGSPAGGTGSNVAPWMSDLINSTF